MWARLWRIDTLFETGQLRMVQRELADLDVCLERVRDPLGRWHRTHCAATLALATGRFTEATRLAGESYKLFSDMGHPIAFGAYSVILSQAGMYIGCDRSGLTELFGRIPDHLKPGAVDTTRGLATVFPALTLALIRLDQGDRAGAEAAYALAGPVRPGRPTPATRMAAWGHGLAVAIPLGRTEDVEFLAARFEPFRGQHVANGAGGGVYLGPVELPLGRAAAARAVSTRRWRTWRRRSRPATPTAPAAAPCRPASSSPRRWPAGRRRATPAGRGPRWTPRRARPSGSGWCRSPSGSSGCGPGSRLRLPGSPLSPRELEVARLVARGLTNKQIGQALYVSERTAENHVQHILTKLGLRNRSQIAAWASAGEAAAGSPGMSTPAGRE